MTPGCFPARKVLNSNQLDNSLGINIVGLEVRVSEFRFADLHILGLQPSNFCSPQGLKPGSNSGLYAALKRRSSTSPSVPIFHLTAGISESFLHFPSQKTNDSLLLNCCLRPPLKRLGRLPGEYRRDRSASFVFCLPSVFRAACACGKYRRRSTWR